MSQILIEDIQNFDFWTLKYFLLTIHHPILMKAALHQAIEPSVQKCVSKFNAMDSAGAITNLRKRAQILISESNNVENNRPVSESKIKRINQILHGPTISLREGKEINESHVMSQIRDELKRKA